MSRGAIAYSKLDFNVVAIRLIAFHQLIKVVEKFAGNFS